MHNHLNWFCLSVAHLVFIYTYQNKIHDVLHLGGRNLISYAFKLSI